jgi:nucleolar pre-ribosomal-associated protein 1
MPAEDKTANCLPHVIQSWSFAAQTDNDSLLSSVPAVLALLLKVISTSIDFRAFGLALCKSLLRHDQLKLFDRGLTANKTKEHLISPCLRLLTEISLFDGGSSARCLHQQRDITFKRLDIFLGMRNQSAVAPTDRPKPSIRRNALRYLLANLRLQQQCEKSDILAQGKLIRAVFQDIKKDEPEIIVEILDALRRTVLLDESLVRAAKSRLLTDWTLSRIASLYDYTEDQRTQVGQAAVQDSAHEFLMFVCTTLDHGTLLIQQGWYPPGADIFKDRPDETTDQCYPHHQRLGNKYIDKVPVCNTALASLIKRLRPHVSMRQKELILAIFSVAPELIAAYFSTKSPLSFEPKLSTAWVGWSAFIFSVVQLHPSTKFLSLTRLPPPTSIVIESIYPQTLNQNSLIRCLNQKSGLITFLATRLLILAFQKLEEVLALFRTRQHRKVWVEGASCLTIEFSQRCPGLRYVIAAFKSCSPDRILLRESLARLISLYYSVIPRLALEEKFNVSTSLAGLLDTGSEIITNSPIRKIDLLATQHLLEVACRTLNNDMKWFKKPSKLHNLGIFSLLTLLIRRGSVLALHVCITIIYI